jgi:putative membrane protein
MKKQLAALTIALGLFAAGTKLQAQDKMQDNKTSQDRMSDDKMSNDKMSNDKMSSDKVDDAQIVGIVLAADQIDIDYGKIALQKSKDAKVREFAQRMVTDHSAVQKSVIKLAGKLGVNAEDSQTSTGLKSGAADITKKLKTLKAKEFDEFYIDNEVSYHKTVTDAVDAVLIPSAQNSELKSALQGAQPLFRKHLEHARSVQSGQGDSMAH